MNLLTASRHSDRYIYNVRGICFEFSFRKDSIVFRRRVGTDLGTLITKAQFLRLLIFMGYFYYFVKRLTPQL